VLVGFGAALLVAALIGAASWSGLASLGEQLELVSASQLPTVRALSGALAGFKDTQRFLSHLAFSRQTNVVLQAGDCRDCHGDATVFEEHSDEALALVEASRKELDAMRL